MSDFDKRDEFEVDNPRTDSGRETGGFAKDNSCGNGYERHEDHSHSREAEDNYSRGEREGYYTSGSGTFYRREANFAQGVHTEPEKKKTSGLAVASLVCGIIGLVGCCVPYIGVILSILGLIFGIITIAKGFNGFSLAGIILSSFALVFGIISLIITISAMGNWFDFIQSIIDSSFDDPFDPNFGAAINSVVSVFKRL